MTAAVSNSSGNPREASLAPSSVIGSTEATNQAVLTSPIGSTGAAQTTWTDPGAPVGIERHYVVTSRVVIDGMVVESQPSTPASGTASCLYPPPPVINHPTVAGQPIQITPSQVPIWIRGTAISGSVISLLHDGATVETKTTSSVFYFYDVEVHPGSNSYVVRQELHGTITDSAPIVVELDPSLVSDLVAVSLTITPSAAAPEDLVMVEGTIELVSASGGGATFDALIELEDSGGVTSEVYRTRISLTAGERRTIRTGWIANGPAGEYDWRLTVDPDDEVLEVDEGNNLAVGSSFLLEGAGTRSEGQNRRVNISGWPSAHRCGRRRQCRATRGLSTRIRARRRRRPVDRRSRFAPPARFRRRLA